MSPEEFLQMKNIQRASFYYPQEVSTYILNLMLRQEPLSWAEAEQVLDLIVPFYVKFGYKHIAGFKEIMQKYNLEPSQINCFKDYDTLFPGITLQEIEEIGKEKFHLAKPNFVLSSDSDIKPIAKLIIGDLKKKRRQIVEIPFTKADERAASIAIRGKISREGLPPKVYISPVNSDSQSDELYSNVLFPALFSAGISISYIDTKPNDYCLENSTQAMLNIAGNITFQQSLYPHFGYQQPFPTFTRVVNEKGSLVRDHKGNPDVNRRGGIVMDRFFSCYELPTPWTMFYHALRRAIDLLSICEEPFSSKTELEQVWDPDLQGQYSFKEHFTNVCGQSGLLEDTPITFSILHHLYTEVAHKYFLTSVIIGYPYSWLPKLRLEVAAKMDYGGKFTNMIPIHVKNTNLFTPGADLEILSTTQNTAYLQNIVGKSTQLSYPIAVTPTVRKRVKNVVVNQKTEEAYLYAMPLICPGDFTSMLENAQHYTKPTLQQQPVNFDDALSILQQLHQILQQELQQTLDQKESVYSLFIKKTGLPLKEIKDQIELISESFLQENGKGIKRLAYSAFVDSFAPFNLSEQELKKGVDELQQQKPLAPFFLVTPSNVNFYDAFYIFVQILLGKMTSQQQKNFTLYVRPSVSDLVFSFMIHHFHEITARLDPENKKGLRSLIQKAYWDHTYDAGFLHDSIKAAQGGIYYGTAKVYREVVLNAILEKPDVAPLLDEKIITKIKLGRDENNSLNITQLQEVPHNITSTIQKHLSRHKVYNETLNAAVILSSEIAIEQLELEKIVSAIVTQVIKLRGADCTSLQNVWIPQNILSQFLEQFKQKVAQLRAGDLFDITTTLAYYETSILKKAQTIMQQRGNSQVIKPQFNGKEDEKHHTGVIITQTKALDLDQQHKAEVECLAHEIALPWLNLIIYNSEQELIDSMETVQQKYAYDSGYPRYLYISVFNGGYQNPTPQAESFKQQINARNMTDFFKEGEEAFRQFMFYRPHQGSFFLKDLVE